MTWKDYLAVLNEKWVGNRVMFDGQIYTVVDIDSNGALMIDKPSQFNKTTAIGEEMVQQAGKKVVTRKDYCPGMSFHCPDCGKALFWGVTRCPVCKIPLDWRNSM